MKVLLIQADGKIPNLALMKIARYHRNNGDSVDLIKGIAISSRLTIPDKVYISCIFEENKSDVLKMAAQFPHSQVFLGGPGVDLTSKLPDFIEHLMPDYDLFGCNYSMGFTTRGCIRKCPFCIVPEKEGYIQAVADIYEFWDRRHKIVALLDNNIFALPDQFYKIADQIIKNKLIVNFTSGLDIRLIDSGLAEKLAKLTTTNFSSKKHPNREFTFAWDNINDEDKILSGLKILSDAGLNRSRFYVLSGFNTTFEDDLYRLNRLKELKQRPYLMRYKYVRGNRLYSDLARWANQPQFFAKMDFKTFQLKVYPAAPEET